MYAFAFFLLLLLLFNYLIWFNFIYLSAIDALQLIVANPLRALVLNGVTAFVLFLGSLLITIGTGVLGFYFFTKSFYIDPSWTLYFAPTLHYFWAPLIVVVIGIYYIYVFYIKTYFCLNF